MIGVPHVARLLGPLRQMPAVAEEPLRDILLRISELASELPWLRALDISSLLADENGDVDTHYLSDAISSGDIVRSFVDSARAGEVKNTPFEITVNNGGFHVSKVERF
jgi:hypothetical protein